MDRTRTALVRLALGLAGAVALASVPLPASAQEQLFFSSAGGNVACVVESGSPTPGTVPRLTITNAAAFAGVQYECPSCEGTPPATPPTTPPSFWFKSEVVSDSTLGSPRLLILFNDLSSMYLQPLTWTGLWQFVDGAGDTWVSQDGDCGFVYGVSYASARACHTGRGVLATYIVTDSGQLTTPYRHFIDDVKIGTTTFSSCILEPALTLFRDVRRANDISLGPDLAGTGHFAKNFQRSAGAPGDTWIAVFDETPDGTEPTILTGTISLSADVVITAFNNKKGAGVLALYNQGLGKKGLALTVYDNGNTDTLVLSTVDQAGKLTPLKTVSLGAGIAEGVWYRVELDVLIAASAISVGGKVWRHALPGNPDSPLTTQVGTTLAYSGTLGVGPLAGVDGAGQVGIVASAVSAAVNTSATNFVIDPASGNSAPPIEIIFD